VWWVCGDARPLVSVQQELFDWQDGAGKKCRWQFASGDVRTVAPFRIFAMTYTYMRNRSQRENERFFCI